MECGKLQTIGEELVEVGRELNNMLKLVPNL